MRITLLIIASLITACVSAPARRPIEKQSAPRSAPGGVYKSGGTAFGGGGPASGSGGLLLASVLLYGVVGLAIWGFTSIDLPEQVDGPNVGDADTDVCPLGPVSCNTHGW